MRYKVSGAIAIPKASWGCAPALPNRIQMVSLRITIPNQKPQANKKFFDPAIFQKCWRGVGEQPTFAEQIKFCSLFSLLQLQFLILPNLELAALMKQVANSDKATGQLLHAGRQKQGWNPLLPDAEDRFP